MVSYTINDIMITCSEDITHEEAENYVARAPEGCAQMRAETDGADVNLTYFTRNLSVKPVPFERIRRITGYLVGTTKRFNNSKRAEERDRVKHSIS